MTENCIAAVFHGDDVTFLACDEKSTVFFSVKLPEGIWLPFQSYDYNDPWISIIALNYTTIIAPSMDNIVH